MKKLIILIIALALLQGCGNIKKLLTDGLVDEADMKNGVTPTENIKEKDKSSVRQEDTTKQETVIPSENVNVVHAGPKVTSKAEKIGKFQEIEKLFFELEHEPNLIQYIIKRKTEKESTFLTIVVLNNTASINTWFDTTIRIPTSSITAEYSFQSVFADGSKSELTTSILRYFPSNNLRTVYHPSVQVTNSLELFWHQLEGFEVQFSEYKIYRASDNYNFTHIDTVLHQPNTALIPIQHKWTDTVSTGNYFYQINAVTADGEEIQNERTSVMIQY